MDSKLLCFEVTKFVTQNQLLGQIPLALPGALGISKRLATYGGGLENMKTLYLAGLRPLPTILEQVVVES
jgi:hypothetical protein